MVSRTELNHYLSAYGALPPLSAKIITGGRMNALAGSLGCAKLAAIHIPLGDLP